MGDFLFCQKKEHEVVLMGFEKQGLYPWWGWLTQIFLNKLQTVKPHAILDTK